MASWMRCVGAGAILSIGVESTVGLADEVRVEMHLISPKGVGEAIGTIALKDTHHGITIVPHLKKLPPGKHAFHIHENPDCGAGMKDGKMVAGLKAGGHYDPTGGDGHKMSHHKPHGDLPDLTAGPDGVATAPVSSDKLTAAAVRGRAIMVHRYGENEPGRPKGGGARLACGVIPK